MTEFVAVCADCAVTAVTIELVKEGDHAPRAFSVPWSYLMIVSAVSVGAVAMSDSVAIAETVSVSVAVSASETAGIGGDRRWNRVSVVTVVYRWRRVRDSRCGVSNLCNGGCVRYLRISRCDELRDSRGNHLRR